MPARVLLLYITLTHVLCRFGICAIFMGFFLSQSLLCYFRLVLRSNNIHLHLHHPCLPERAFTVSEIQFSSATTIMAQDQFSPEDVDLSSRLSVSAAKSFIFTNISCTFCE